MEGISVVVVCSCLVAMMVFVVDGCLVQSVDHGTDHESIALDRFEVCVVLDFAVGIYCLIIFQGDITRGNCQQWCVA